MCRPLKGKLSLSTEEARQQSRADLGQSDWSLNIVMAGVLSNGAVSFSELNRMFFPPNLTLLSLCQERVKMSCVFSLFQFQITRDR